MEFKNKWNHKIYKLISKSDSGATLEREDGSQFTIPNSELKFNYFEI